MTSALMLAATLLLTLVTHASGSELQIVNFTTPRIDTAASSTAPFHAQPEEPGTTAIYELYASTIQSIGSPCTSQGLGTVHVATCSSQTTHRPPAAPHLERPALSFVDVSVEQQVDQTESSAPSEIVSAPSGTAPALSEIPSTPSEIDPNTFVYESLGTDGGFRPHLEITENAFDGADTAPTGIPKETYPAIDPITVTIGGIVLEPIPITSVEIGDRTLVAGGETATLGTGAIETLIHVDPNGQPVVIVGTSTSTYHAHITIGDTSATLIPSGLIIGTQTLRSGTPITVGVNPDLTTLMVNQAGRTLAVQNGATSTLQAPAAQVFTIGEIAATAMAQSYQYAIGSTTLAIDNPITINNDLVSLTTNSDGATIIVVGESTTTLPPAQSTRKGTPAINGQSATETSPWADPTDATKTGHGTLPTASPLGAAARRSKCNISMMIGFAALVLSTPS